MHGTNRVDRHVFPWDDGEGRAGSGGDRGGQGARFEQRMEWFVGRLFFGV